MNYLFSEKEVEEIVLNSSRVGFIEAFKSVVESKSIMNDQIIIRRIISDKQMEEIMNIVCAYFNITIDKLKEKNRSRYVKDARFVYFYFSRFKIKTSLKSIADSVGLTHATVIHGSNKIKDWYDVGDYEIVSAVDTIREILEKRGY